MGLGCGQRLKTLPFQRRLLGVADTALHLPLAIWIADATGHSDGAVVGEHVAVEGIDFWIVDVGTQHAFGEIVEHDIFGRSAEAAEGGCVQLRPNLRTRMKAEQPDAFAAESERQNEEPGAAVVTGFRIANLRAGTVVDLSFLARRRDDDGAGFPCLCAPLLADEAFDGFVGAGEAVVVDQFLPDRHGVAAGQQALLNELAVGLAGAGGTGRADGHLIGRFWRGTFAPRPGRTQGDPGRLQIGRRGFATNPGLLLDPTQRPA